MATTTTRTDPKVERGERTTKAGPPVDNAGDHPAEMGVVDGAAIGLGVVGGAASGMAAGLAAGPVGVVAGAVAGAVIGGMAGRGLGLVVDPTTDDDELRKQFPTRSYVTPGQTFESYVPLYRYGAALEAKFPERPFLDVESDGRSEYERGRYAAEAWPSARAAVADGFERARQLRRDRAATRG
jgi:hypothetical protein